MLIVLCFLAFGRKFSFGWSQRPMQEFVCSTNIECTRGEEGFGLRTAEEGARFAACNEECVDLLHFALLHDDVYRLITARVLLSHTCTQVPAWSLANRCFGWWPLSIIVDMSCHMGGKLVCQASSNSSAVSCPGKKVERNSAMDDSIGGS